MSSTQEPPGEDQADGELDPSGFSKAEILTVTGPVEEGFLGRRNRRVSEGHVKPEPAASPSADQPPGES